MTLAQIDMYLGDDARKEAENPGAKIDPKTGHTLVPVSSQEEGLKLLRKTRGLRDA